MDLEVWKLLDNGIRSLEHLRKWIHESGLSQKMALESGNCYLYFG